MSEQSAIATHDMPTGPVDVWQMLFLLRSVVRGPYLDGSYKIMVGAADLEAIDAALTRPDPSPALLSALEETQRVLDMLVEPEAIQSSTVIHAYAQVIAAKHHASKAIAQARGQ